MDKHIANNEKNVSIGNENNILVIGEMPHPKDKSGVLLSLRDILFSHEDTCDSIVNFMAYGLERNAKEAYSMRYNYQLANYMIDKHHSIVESLVKQYINSNDRCGMYTYEEYGFRFLLLVCEDMTRIILSDCITSNETSLDDDNNPDEGNSEVIKANVDDIKKLWCNILEKNRDLILATNAWCHVDEMYESAISSLSTLTDNEAVLLSWDLHTAGIVGHVNNECDFEWVKKGIALGCNVILHFEHRGGSVVKYLKVR